ncbi:MAG: non-canonical purine NTP diphosphatase [Bacteroidota bacterium]|nr:non-canonical purine NTP diphosphatase [Bacteroidota bacterium]
MRDLVFATNNAHKLAEVSAILGSQIRLSGLKEIGCFEEIPEDQSTIEGNALQKARFVYEKYRKDCFSDDTGLEVAQLNGEPGVYSARYAGEACIAENNIRKLLDKLDGETNRKARFRTVVALILDGKEYLFEGIVNGIILTEKHGDGGFGYDPVFQPEGYSQTFAEMSMVLKNKISHRALAIQKLTDFLTT